MRAGETLAYRQATATNPETINNYFDQLEEILVSNSLGSCPSRIYNIDESGFTLQHHPGKRIAVRGQKHVTVPLSNDKTQVTVMACVSAAGSSIPPMVVFKRSNLTEDLIQGEVPDTLYGLSKSGWMDGDLFTKWFRYHFLTHVPPVRPILILLDGHSSHYNPNVIREAAENDVILFCLPPNITHVAQPLDITPFHSLKSHWYNACEQYMSSHPGKTVTIYNFSKIFSQAWYQTMIPRTIMAGFRATGVYPFNRRAISIPGSEKRTATPTAKLAYQQGIKYLQFYSPHHGKHCQELQLSEQQHSSETVLPTMSLEKDNFSEEEHHLFERRYEEGYDIADTRYQKWLQQRKAISVNLSNSPPLQNFQCSLSAVPAHDQQHSGDAILQPPDELQEVHDVNSKQVKILAEPLWKEFLKVPSPAYKITHLCPGKARVLTSVSFLHNLAEKEKKKQEAAEEKERRKKEREKKRILKQKMKKQQREKKILQKNANGKKRKGVSSQPKEVLPFSDDDDNGCMCINVNI